MGHLLVKKQEESDTFLLEANSELFEILKISRLVISAPRIECGFADRSLFLSLFFFFL